ncbi:PspA/IM30 family protein [Alsobacter sp. SYSU BS001988]|jgi:phage shock protein A
MAESIFARVSRLLSAAVEDSVDRLEKAGGEAVMREAIREADRAVDQVKAELEATMTRRLQAARQHQLTVKRIEELTSKAQFAIHEGREDLAEAAIARQIDFEAQAGALLRTQEQAREEETRLEDGLGALQARKAQMEEALANFEVSKREASVNVDGTHAPLSPEKKVHMAEQAFERAMKGAGGVPLGTTDVAAIKKVAEIDGLQRSAAIAERLSALKAQKVA